MSQSGWDWPVEGFVVRKKRAQHVGVPLLRSSLLLGVALIVASSLTGCTSEEDLLRNATCEGKALTSREDGRKVVGLVPDGVYELTSRYSEYDSRSSRAFCLIREREGEERKVIVLKAWFGTSGTEPSQLSLRELDQSGAVDGRKARITSKSPRVGGVSGEADAALSAPCTLPESESDSPLDMRRGTLHVTASSDNAPDPDSPEQRQNAADLTLSFLRHAVQRCDDPPELPAKVHIEK
ncbi:hypothetical protein [Streptomyces sp. HNM0574]|uniref:hypothetical protein n=1 Tax=Streptomyces sp. HNM0574 TaxID=2714954 RepID=UPI00146EF8C3|nr:hypothetical protein [Streptomyces sp. HNM0574]NLU69594.1 hypothetical protein [Streptomyces sp. HNM0574]